VNLFHIKPPCAALVLAQTEERFNHAPATSYQAPMYIGGTIGYGYVMMEHNSTRDYHLKSDIDLMREYTINESLSSLDSHYMACIEKPRPFGQIVAEKLDGLGLLRQGSTIMEAGGGYGSFMEAFLNRNRALVKNVLMVDLSPCLLRKQRKRLEAFREIVSFINADIQEILPAVSGIDLIIMNEVIGDLDTTTGLEPGQLPDGISAIIEKYGLDMPETGVFSLNTGAIKAVEAICEKGIPAYISEHSCDPVIPESMPWLASGLDLDSWPREIRLYSHSEYTIRFGHLIKVAQHFGRKILTGSYAELVGVRNRPFYRFMFESGACTTPEQEIVLEFFDHIREYRWLIIL